MTVLAAFSYTLLAYGTPIALFLVTVARQPHEVIVLILGAFFWLLSFLLSSIIWIIVPPLRDYPAFTLPISVLLQEASRWLYYRLIRKADNLLEMVSEDNSELGRHKLAYVGGLGFGLISGIVAYANVIEAASGPGIVGIDGSSSQYMLLTSAFGALVITLLHVCWGVLWFDGLERKHWWWLIVVPVTHMLVSGLSLLNDHFSPVYFLVVAYATLSVLSCLSMFVAGARPMTLRSFITF